MKMCFSCYNTIPAWHIQSCVCFSPCMNSGIGCLWLMLPPESFWELWGVWSVDFTNRQGTENNMGHHWKIAFRFFPRGQLVALVSLLEVRKTGRGGKLEIEWSEVWWNKCGRVRGKGQMLLEGKCSLGIAWEMVASTGYVMRKMIIWFRNSEEWRKWVKINSYLSCWGHLQNLGIPKSHY